MTKRVFIFHRWGASPLADWYPWLKMELEQDHFVVQVPQMPTAETPLIDEWVNAVQQAVVYPDADTILIGHSIGAQALLRYMANLAGNVEISGMILISPWLHLTEKGAARFGEAGKPWLNKPIDLAMARQHTRNICSIFSSNNPYVPMSDTDILRSQLGSEILLADGQGLLTQEEGVHQLPSALEKIITWTKSA